MSASRRWALALQVRQPGHQIIPETSWESLGSSLRLAPREIQVIQGIFDDRKEIAIADELGISQHTVHTYLERVYRKLSVGSRVGLVVRVMAELMDQDAADDTAS